MMFIYSRLSILFCLQLFHVATVIYFFCLIFSGCKFTLTQDSGTFQSPDFPGKYPNDMECIWNIQVQPGRFVLLSFDVFELESYRGKCIDLVEVKDGSRSTDQLLGTCTLHPRLSVSSLLACPAISDTSCQHFTYSNGRNKKA